MSLLLFPPPAIRRILRSVFVSLALVPPQPAATLNSNEALAFDYVDADFEAWQIVEFQASWDDGTWKGLGIPVPFKDTGTTADASSYQALVPFTSGRHTARFRACSEQQCGAASDRFVFRVKK